jgi:hypothetical protein
MDPTSCLPAVPAPELNAGDGAATGIVSILTEEQQALVNINRQCVLKPKTIQSYNNKLMAIISFLEMKATENDQFITNGMIHDLVVPIDLSTVDDKAAYQMIIRPLRSTS